jgi:hypothetical protein
MPALIGYMLAIVVTLGGYFAGLHWLISPPDPWQASARTQTSSAHAVAARKRAPPKPVEIAASIEHDTLKDPEIKLATTEAPPAVPVAASATASPVEPAVLSPSSKQSAPPRAEEKPPARTEAARPEPRRETKPKPAHRKLADRSSGRKLQLMVLRTYERDDGTRFSRLLPLSEARSAMAFQSEW